MPRFSEPEDVRAVCYLRRALQTRTLLHHFRLLDDHRLHRHIAVHPPRPGGHSRNGVHHVLSFDNPAKHRITEIAHPVVQKFIVCYVDEELRRGGMNFPGAGHGDSVFVIPEPVVGLVLDRRMAGLGQAVGRLSDTGARAVRLVQLREEQRGQGQSRGHRLKHKNSRWNRDLLG